jgi:hypothetical protein
MADRPAPIWVVEYTCARCGKACRKESANSAFGRPRYCEDCAPLAASERVKRWRKRHTQEAKVAAKKQNDKRPKVDSYMRETLREAAERGMIRRDPRTKRGEAALVKFGLLEVVEQTEKSTTYAITPAGLDMVPDLPPDLNPRQESALSYLTSGAYPRITNQDIQNLHINVHPETIRRDLAELVSRGLLVKRGQKRGTYYVLPGAQGSDVGQNDVNGRALTQSRKPADLSPDEWDTLRRSANYIMEGGGACYLPGVIKERSGDGLVMEFPYRSLIDSLIQKNYLAGVKARRFKSSSNPQGSAQALTNKASEALGLPVSVEPSSR